MDAAAIAARREHCRHVVLAKLYERDRLPPMPAQGVADALSRTHQLTVEEVESALMRLEALGFVESTKDPFGPTLYWKISEAGQAFYENPANLR